MTESWKNIRADEVNVGDVVRTASGEVVVVSRIETSFLGRANMLALIEDTEHRWYKLPVPVDADVQIRTDS